MSINTVQRGELEYLVSDRISVPHAFTTRRGGVSGGYLQSLNLGMHRGDSEANVRENYRILGETLGFSPACMVLANQVHGDRVLCVDRADCRGADARDYPPCDALITACPDCALVVFTADCTPILLYDPRTGAVGAAHAGWRGTAACIAARTVEAMQAHFGTRPEDIHAAIGPNIGPCCFETHGDVPQAMRQALGAQADPFLIPFGPEKFHVDLKGLNAHILRLAGVTQIDVSTDCAACQSSRFWSHRVTGGQRGSQGDVIVCKGGRK